MAIYSAARQRIIVPGANDPRIVPRVGILHVDAGNAESLEDYFRHRSGGIESHFHIPKVKQIEQYRDTSYEADANYLANPFATSVETQGLAHEEWNDKQLEDIKALMVWSEVTDGIPLKECVKWDGEGWGYHIKFGAPGKWTPVAKSCPGPLRIQQFHDLLVPWMKEENDMFTDTDRKLLKDLATEVADLKKQVADNNTKDYKRFKTLKDLIQPK